MTKTIQDIPNEMLKHILVQLREQGGFSSLKKALLVSHLWNDAGTPVLYEHVVLHNGNISSFLDVTIEPRAGSWDLATRFHSLFFFSAGQRETDPSKTFNGTKALFLKPLPSIDELKSEELKSEKSKKCIRDRKKTWEQVHSLTLNVKPEGAPSVRWEQQNREQIGELTTLDQQLMRLASMLPTQFPLLNTFSLFSEEVHMDDQTNQTKMEREGAGFFDVRVIHALVAVLPESVTNLHLDTNGRDIQFGLTSPRMCLLIQKMMPRLRHLFLRVSYICDSIIDLSRTDDTVEFVQAPYLLSLGISFVPRNIPFWFDLMYARNVCDVTHSQDATARLRNDHPLGSNNERATIRLAETLIEARDQGCFPHATNIQIITPMRIHRRNWAWSKRENDNMMVIRDVVRSKTHALQFIPANTVYAHDVDRAIKDRHGGFIMGNHQKLKLMAEDGEWDATAKCKARLPIDTPDVQFQKSTLHTRLTKRKLAKFIRDLANEPDRRLQILHKDLTEGERHPGRVFEFDGAGFAFKDFIPENF